MQKGLNSASFEHLLLNCPLQQLKQETACVTLATDPTGTNLLGLIYGTLETAASRDPKHQFLVWGKNIFRWENRLTSVSHPSLACCPHRAPDSSSREGCACVPGKGRGCHLCAQGRPGRPHPSCHGQVTLCHTQPRFCYASLFLALDRVDKPQPAGGSSLGSVPCRCNCGALRVHQAMPNRPALVWAPQPTKHSRPNHGGRQAGFVCPTHILM